MPHAYGRIPDRPDSRDHLFALKIAAPPTLPPKVTLGSLPAVLDQGQLGSCVWHATAVAALYDALKQGEHAELGSRLYGYFRTRVLEKTTKVDAGCSIRDAFKVLAKDGVPPESLWPYDVAKFAQRPPRRAYSAAKAHKAIEYLRVDQTVPALKAAIAAGYPVVVGITVAASFEGGDVAQTGLVPMPAPGEPILGGHALLAYAYDDGAQRVRCRNSWGGWGDGGDALLPYAYLGDPAWSADWWTVRSVS